MKNQTMKRLLAILLAVFIFASVCPLTAFAATPVNVGGLRADPSNPAQTSDGFIYSLSDGTVSETWTNYYASSDDCVTLLKKGSSTPVAIGQLTEYGTSDGILLNRGNNVFCIRNSQWNLNCAGHSDLTPLEEGDVMVVKGQFATQSGSTVINISETYITKNADGTLNFSSSVPQPPIEAGEMKQNPDQPALNNGSFYFKMDDNDIPFTEGDWDNAFYAKSADCIKLIRDGSDPVSVAIPAEGRGVFVKYSQNGYYLNTGNAWFIGDSAPLKAGDTLIVEGEFTNGTVTFNVTKSVIKIEEDDKLTFGEEGQKPEVIEAGVMLPSDKARTNKDFYFEMEENAVPADPSKTTYYKPVSADVIQRTRDGETFNTGNPMANTLAKLSDTEWYMKLNAIGGAIIPGDVIRIEGNFTDGTLTFHISESIITCNADGTLTFSGDSPSVMKIVEAGEMKEHENGKTDNGIYFSLDENEAPFLTDWTLAYTPETADCIQLVRDNKTTGIANPAAETIVKFSETGYYLKTESYTMGSYVPLKEGDILIIEGNFINEAENVALHFDTCYIQIKDGKAVFSTEYPEDDNPPEVIEAGHMLQSDKEKTGSGFYFTMEANDVPADSTWTDRYSPVSADVITLTRDGETKNVGNTAAGTVLKYNDTGWWMENWAIGGALQPGDILTVSGNFSGPNNVTFHISTSYVLCNADGSLTVTDTLPEPVTVIEAGIMHRSDKAPESDGFYFEMDTNDVPIDSTWIDRYQPVSADVITLTRDGETKNVGNIGAGTVLKYSENGWYMAYWAIGGALQPGDVLTVSGNFEGPNGVVFHISESTVEVNADGSLTVNGEAPAVQTRIEAGVLAGSDAGRTDTGIYCTMDANEAPYLTDWTLAYKPTAESCVKLVRGDETFPVARPVAEILVKYDETKYYLKTEAYTMGDSMPLQEGDILIVEGDFINEAENVILNITASYIRIENGQAVFYTEYPTDDPVTEIIEAGIMHRSDKAPASDGFFFEMEANDVPIDSAWTDRYMPLEPGVILRTRNGETTAVGNTGAGTILKYSANGWFMAYWAIGGALLPGDMLTVSGNFSGPNGVVFHISQSVITVNDDGSLTVNGEEPPKANRIAAGTLKGSDAGRTETGIYCTMDANAAPYDEGWTLAYKPTSEGCIKLVRNSETIDIARPAAETLVKYGASKYYLKTEEYTMGGIVPLQEGDILIVEGDFLNEETNVILNITTSYIKIQFGQAVFSDTYPEDKPVEVIQAGYLQQDSRPRTSDGIYAVMDVNAAPYSRDWTLEYQPVSESCIKLVRDGETYDVAIPGRGTLVKFNEQGYFLKTNNWSIGDYAPLQVGDILIVEGQFVNGETVMEISRSYISIQNGKTVISTEYPSGDNDNIIEAGVMKQSEANPGLYVDTANGSCGIYFTMQTNDVPLKPSDPWSNRFYPVEPGCIKLIRNGETIDISNVDAGEIVKFKSNDYYLALDKWSHSAVYPITEDDILVVEGLFTDGNTVFHISKSYISFQYGTAFFSTEYPSGGNDFRIVYLQNVQGDSRGMAETGVYFDAAVNAAPYGSDWRTAYAPTESSCVQLIRNGQTYTIGMPGRETIVKFSATEYFVKGDNWALGSFAPLREGDVLVISGEFVNAANHVVISVPTTYIGMWYGKAFVSSHYMSGPAVSTVDAGDVMADERELQPGGVYFDLEENSAPSNSDWTLEYSPVSSDCLQLIRDGKTYSIGTPSHGTIVKFKDTEYYLKLDNWSIGGFAPLQDGDIFILSGQFINVQNSSGTILNFPETYIFIKNGEAIIAKSMGEIELPKDGEMQLTVENPPEGETVTWFSENDKRLSVDQNGTITALTNRGRIRVFATAGKYTWFWTVQLYEETEFGKVYFSSSEDDLPIAMWAGDYHSFTNKNLEALEEAGVTMLVGVKEDLVGEGGLWGLLNRAKQHNISVIADIRGWDGKTPFSYAKHPALKGFLVWDEPATGDFDDIKALKDSFDAVMPNGLGFYVNLNSEVATYEALYGDAEKHDADYEKDYADAFIETVEPEDIFLNVPALRTTDEKNSEAPLAVTEAYFSCFNALAQKALENELPLTYTMHCLGGKTDEGTLAEPTEDLLRWQFALGLTFGARTIAQDAFVSDGTDALYDTETRKTTDLFDSAETVNLEFLSWGDIILSYDWLGISKLDVGEENPMLAAVKHDTSIGSLGCLKAADSTQDLLIGSFRNGDGGFAYMVTNAGNAALAEDGAAELSMEETTVTLTLKDGDYQCVALICKGEITYIAVNADNTVSFDLGANEGIFVVPFVK